MNTVHHVRSDIIAAIPHLLGNHPTEAVVVLGCRNHALRTAVSHDLDTDFGATVRSLRRHYIKQAILVGYSDEGDLPGAVARAHSHLCDADIDIIDYLLVTRGRWLGLNDDTPHGHAIPTTGRLAIELAADGYRRGANIDIDPVDSHARRSVSEHLASVAGHADDFSEAIRGQARRLIDNAATNSYPPARDIAILIAAAWDRAIAGDAMERIRLAPTPRVHLDMWKWVTRHACGPDVAAPAVLAAAAAHLCAESTLATCFARAAMTASIGWPSALLTHKILTLTTTNHD